jgi:alpha-L-arabinofuranosidase
MNNSGFKGSAGSAVLRGVYSPSRDVRLAWICGLLVLLSVICQAQNGREKSAIQNGGFESSVVGQFWQVRPQEAKQKFSMSLDRSDAREGQQSLLVEASDPVNLTLRQEIFLPVGTLWRVTGWTKSQISANVAKADAGPRIGIDSQVGKQDFSPSFANDGGWHQHSFLFRVPSPGRITIALDLFDQQSGKAWVDDIRLEPVAEAKGAEAVTITDERLSKRPIDPKQGGQFIEPLCDVIPSMTAQQVQSSSFEEETPWSYAYKEAVDKPYRPWYPDGSVHDAEYSFDTNNPFNGKRSQRIELPVANTWAGISQDGFYLEAGHSYRLRLHMRGEGNPAIRASLHGEGTVVAGPRSLGRGTSEWQGFEVVLSPKRTLRNATLTIEFEGPGTLWLDRVYLIDTNAVLGLWRPDVVKALQDSKPYIVRFGGSTIETFEWTDTIGNWDKRVPFSDDPWGGLQDNFVGPEETTQLIQHVGAEPLIAVRWTGRGPQDAANEVEYFNGNVETKWGSLRAKNGHPKPYNVKYWEVGNEVGGTPEYDASVTAFAQAMLRVDPSIKILSSDPSQNIVRIAGSVLDYLTPHQYSVGDLNGTEEELKQLRDFIQRDANGKDIRVSVTEWNASADAWGLARGMLHTLGNALICSRYRNMMHRYADLVEIANISNFSRSFAGGQIQPGPGYLYMIPSYSTQILYQRAAGSYPLQVNRSSPLAFYLREPDLDATLSPDGKTLRIYGVNSTAQEHRVSFSLPRSLGGVQSAEELVVGDRHAVPDSEAMNLPDDPNRIFTQTKKIAVSRNGFEFGFKPFSVTLLELHLAGK